MTQYLLNASMATFSDGRLTKRNMARFMEIRVLGSIDLEDVYGVGSMRSRKQIEMVIPLEEWDAEKEYDRLGTGFETKSLLGVDLLFIIIPVKLGRSISIIIEAAVRNRSFIFRESEA